MTNPHTGGGSSIPALYSNSGPNFRRPSYANVAAGTAASHSHAFNTLAGIRAAASNPSSIPRYPVPDEPRTERERGGVHREPSCSRDRTMDVDNAAGSPGWKKSGGGSGRWSGELGRYVDGLGCAQHVDHPAFFTPSYLRHSRHVQRLQRQWEKHVAELQEQAHNNPPRQNPPLSARSSNSNLSKMHAAHVHRGVVQDVIERIPLSSEEDNTHPLPSRWNDDDKLNGCEIMADGCEVRFNGVIKTSDEAAAVRADHPMPRECGIYYYEVTVLSRGKEGLIGIGFSGKKVNLARLPGWEPDSWAYHGDDGYSFACTASGKSYGPRFSSQDVIGCGVNFRTGNAWFTKNGHYLGVAFSNIKGDKLYPSVGMKKPGEHLRVNFGKTPFVFDIDGFVEKERKIIFADLGKADVTSLHPPDDENALIHNLIGQYLAHEGYVETSKAFAADVQDQRRVLTNGAPQISLNLGESDDDINAINRQKIRRAILDGDIDKALKYMGSYYPRVLEDERNRDIYFRLRCRKFIEMMRRYSELQNATSPTMVKGMESLVSNGHASELDGGTTVSDTQMDVDEQLHRESSRSLEFQNEDVEMVTSQELPPKSSLMKQSDLLTAALDYGRNLQAEFGIDAKPQIKKQLSDIFAIMAYTDPKDSVVGQQLDPKGRVRIAEEVNGAILISLGKPSSAALEKVCAQTEALLDEVANKTGGAAAFVNVMRDFLQR